jgi:hypothetical protein
VGWLGKKKRGNLPRVNFSSQVYSIKVSFLVAVGKDLMKPIEELDIGWKRGKVSC